MSNPQKLLKEKIIRIAIKSNDFMNKPRIRNFQIFNLMPLIGGNYSYEKATFELVDSYLNPITGKKIEDVYKCQFDGKLSWHCVVNSRILERA